VSPVFCFNEGEAVDRPTIDLGILSLKCHRHRNHLKNFVTTTLGRELSLDFQTGRFGDAQKQDQGYRDMGIHGNTRELRKTGSGPGVRGLV